MRHHQELPLENCIGQSHAPVAILVGIAAGPGAKVSVIIEADLNVNTAYTAKDEVEANFVKTKRGYWIYSFATHHKDKRMQAFPFVARKDELKRHHLAHKGEEVIYVLEGR